MPHAHIYIKRDEKVHYSLDEAFWGRAEQLPSTSITGLREQAKGDGLGVLVVVRGRNGNGSCVWFELLTSTKRGSSGIYYQLYQTNRCMDKAV